MKVLNCVLIVFLLNLVSCGCNSQPVPPFLSGTNNLDSLPEYIVKDSVWGVMGQVTYTLEWKRPLSQKDSITLKKAISDFYHDSDALHFKCYAQGDSSVCVQFHSNGIYVTKEPTVMFKSVMEDVQEKSKVTMPISAQPLYYSAYYEFPDASYEIGFEKSLISNESLEQLKTWAPTTKDAGYGGAWIDISEDTISNKPVLIINYREH